MLRKTALWRKDSSTAEAILGIPAGMLSKEVWEKHRDVSLLQGNLTPMFLVGFGYHIAEKHLCESKIQPAATGLVAVLVQEEEDAAAQ